jgi:hypothetical protein
MRTSLLICVATVTLIHLSTPTWGKKNGTVSAVRERSTGGTQYRSHSGHFTLRYPSEWSSKPTKEYTLLLERQPTADGARVTVDVPYIPPHLPGMVTMNRVVNGYLDDLKRRLNELEIVERHDDRLCANAARRLVVTGRERAGARRGEQRTIVALIAIRNEQVYILQADATPDLLGNASDALTSIAQSWDWTN